MLFIVFGATLDLGYETRKILRRHGFEVIYKYNYVQDDSKVDKKFYQNAMLNKNYAKWYDDKIYIEETELTKMDFQYGLDGVCVGFNQRQIMEAVRGSRNAILTIGASALQLVRQLKNAYGDYITLIHLYEDEKTVVESTKDIPSEDEKKTRIHANQKMQKIYLDNLDIFDAVVIYTGEETPYNKTFLEKQYENIIQQRRKLEKTLNDKKYVELPYDGILPYIFISYAHRDKENVYPILNMLQRYSYRVWYDDGIQGGKNWRRVLEEKIDNADTILLFHSEQAAKSEHVESQ